MFPRTVAEPPPSEAWPSTPSATAEVWALGWPAIVHLSLLTSVFVADRALVSQLGAGGLAAMHAATSVSWTVASVLGAVAVGALATVGTHVGAGRAAAAESATKASLVFVTLLSGVTTALLWLARDPLLRFIFPALGARAHADAAAYLAVLLPALPVGLFATTLAACRHASRDTRTPLVAALVGNVVNLGVSAALVLGLWGCPELGVVGAAIGSALAFATQAVWLGRDLVAGLRWRDLGQPAPLRRLWQVVRPAFGERISYHGGYLVYAGMVGALGPIAMAAHQGLLGMEAFSFTIAEGLGVAAGALAANHLGAGRHERAERTTLVAVALAAAILSGCGLLFVGLAPSLVGWLHVNDEVATELLRSLPIAALSQPFVAIAVVGTAALRGAGATRVALGITLLGAVGVRLAAAQLLADHGLAGAWGAAACDWGVQAAVVVPLLVRWRSRVSVPEPS